MTVKTVLITGASGAVGSAVVPLFLNEPETQLRLLIRADSASHLQERLGALMDYWQPELEDADAISRVQAFRGDVSEPQLGLQAYEYQQLTEELTHIIHCAANVKMNMSYEQAQKISVDSARYIVGLAEDCVASGQFAKLDFVSTLGVAGKMRGLIPERPLIEAREYHNTYESSKAEAETFVLEKMNAGLPVSIHRPSMVVGDSVTGKTIHFQIFYYLAEFITGRFSFGILPNAGDVKLDIIPSDYVAKALYWSSGDSESTGSLFHLCSGPDHSIRIMDLVVNVRAILASSYDEKLPALIVAPASLFNILLPVLKLVTTKKVRARLSNLPLFLDYLNDQQLFDNTETTQVLSAAGISIPDVNQYLEKVIGYYRQQKYPRS